jgi:hypothetical protein
VCCDCGHATSDSRILYNNLHAHTQDQKEAMGNILVWCSPTAKHTQPTSHDVLPCSSTDPPHTVAEISSADSSFRILHYALSASRSRRCSKWYPSIIRTRRLRNWKLARHSRPATRRRSENMDRRPRCPHRIRVTHVFCFQASPGIAGSALRSGRQCGLVKLPRIVPHYRARQLACMGKGPWHGKCSEEGADVFWLVCMRISCMHACGIL